MWRRWGRHLQLVCSGTASPTHPPPLSTRSDGTRMRGRPIKGELDNTRDGVSSLGESLSHNQCQSHCQPDSACDTSPLRAFLPAHTKSELQSAACAEQDGGASGKVSGLSECESAMEPPHRAAAALACATVRASTLLESLLALQPPDHCIVDRHFFPAPSLLHPVGLCRQHRTTCLFSLHRIADMSNPKVALVTGGNKGQMGMVEASLACFYRARNADVALPSVCLCLLPQASGSPSAALWRPTRIPRCTSCSPLAMRSAGSRQ